MDMISQFWIKMNKLIRLEAFVKTKFSFLSSLQKIHIIFRD